MTDKLKEALDTIEKFRDIDRPDCNREWALSRLIYLFETIASTETEDTGGGQDTRNHHAYLWSDGLYRTTPEPTSISTNEKVEHITREAMESSLDTDEKCPICKGSGSLVSAGYVHCKACGGTGYKDRQSRPQVELNGPTGPGKVDDMEAAIAVSISSWGDDGYKARVSPYPEISGFEAGFRAACKWMEATNE